MNNEKYEGPQPVPGGGVSHRDPTKSYNQLRPPSLRSSGMELDPECYATEQPVNDKEKP